MKKLFVILIFFFFPQTVFASEFSFEFDWSDLKKCTTGNPNTVKNPIFILQNVPNGTKFIYFKLTDKNVPTYNHGGGWVEYKGENEIAPGSFTYKSPCPPSGKHNYEWTASAKAKKGLFASTIAKAKASKYYP